MYKKRNSSSYRPIGSSGLNTESDLASSDSGTEFYELEAAEVVDVIRDSDHVEFRGNEDIGKIRFRFIYSQKNKPESQLFLARPLNANIQKYPLCHEVVLIGRFMGNYYYIDVINHLLNKNHNDLANVSIDPNLKQGATGRSRNYNEGSVGVGDTSVGNSGVELGDTFQINDEFKPLEHDEGDLIIEGRFANSIRFGSNVDTGNPTLKLRAGQFEEAVNLDYLDRIREDINLDPASIYLVQDETVPIRPSTQTSADTHLASAQNAPSEYSGRQIFHVSDRIVLDAKQNQIMLFARDEININTASNFTLDADGSVISDVLGDRMFETGGSITSNISGDLTQSVGSVAEYDIGNRVVWNAPEMYFGAEDRSEPIVLGQTLLDLLNQLLNAIQQQTHPTRMGPSGTPINSPQFAQIQQQLQTILSQQNFTQ